MPTMTVLTLDQKRKIFEAIQKISPEAIHRALIAAALNNELFPIENKEFSELCDLHARIEISAVKLPIRQAVEAFISTKIAGEFQEALSSVFEADKWQSNFLIFLANELHIEVQNQPLVQLTIKNGKIHWRIMKGEQILYDRAARKK